MRAAAALAAISLPALLAAAMAGPVPPGAGVRAYQKCYSCHSLEPGRNELEGPTLYRIVGRPVAAERGYRYSPALSRFADRNPVWTEALLDRFAADPETLVPGTTMSFTGVSDAAERAALIDYLKRHSSERG